jgi:hypothetical protein
MERVAGIEPAWPAWKAGALPLSYTRKIITTGRYKNHKLLPPKYLASVYLFSGSDFLSLPSFNAPMPSCK